MAYSLIKGENVLLEFYDGGVWKPYACARACTLTVTTELIETTVKGSGKFKYFEPTVNSYTVSFDGVCSLADPNSLNIYDLRQYQLGHVLMQARFTRTAEDGVSVYVSTVNFFITSSQDVSSFDNIATFSIEGQGTGTAGQSLINPTPIVTKVKRLEYTGTGGEFSFTNTALINKDVLAVHKDGIGNSKVINTGTPASKEALFDDTTGTVTWAIPFETGEESYVLYQDK